MPFLHTPSGPHFRGGLERQGENWRGARRAHEDAGGGRAQGGSAPHIRQQTGQFELLSRG